MIKILVVGQTPPPYGGQAIMIDEMLRIPDQRFRFHLVKMDFSESIADQGKVKIKKFFYLAGLIFRIILARAATGCSVLYYPPGGPNRIPMYRDIAILLCVRWMFSKTVFHFHAGGVSELYPKLSAFPRFLFRLAYFRPDAGIRISDLNPEDAKLMHAAREFIIPNGIRDLAENSPRRDPAPRPVPRILYAGVLRESKGILVLLEAARLLRDRGLGFTVDIMGSFESKGFEKAMLSKIDGDNLSGVVRLLGVLSGGAKTEAYARSDIFCFPSFFESETFGIVLLEAMSLGMPVVATRWRGIPSIVKDGDSGFLVPIKEASALAGRLETLVADPALRKTMGEKGRHLFEAEFTIASFHRNMSRVFEALS